MVTMRKVFAGAALASLAAVLWWQAMPAQGRPQPSYTEIYSSDSLDLRSPALSPDGKWVVFESKRQDEDNRGSLVSIPAAGGTPVALTSPGYRDGWPVWFPSSDRIVFFSTRVDGLMTLKIDPRTGAAIGVPQRLTVEKTQPMGYSVSPDGRQVLYGTPPRRGRFALKLVPANGGTASLVDSVSGREVPQSYWAADGAIEFAVADSEARYFDLMRASGGRGAPKRLRRFPLASGIPAAGPGYFLMGARVRMNSDTVGTLSLVSHAGDTVARFDSRGTTPPINRRMRFTPQPGTFLLAPGAAREAVHAMSTDGGAPWAVRPVTTGPGTSEWPDGFTADSRGVWVQTRDTLLVVPARGGAPRTIPLPAGTWLAMPAPSGRYVYTYDGHPRDRQHVLQVVNVASGRSELVSSAALDVGVPTAEGDARYFVERKGDRLELRRYTPGAGATTLRSFAVPVGPGRQAASTEALAWVRQSGDSVRVYLDNGSGTPREILALRGGVRAIEWSPTGRSLAISARPIVRGDTSGALYVASLGEGAKPAGAPRQAASGPAPFSAISWAPGGGNLAAVTRIGPDSVLAALYVPVDEAAGQVGKPRVVELPRPAAESYGVYWLPDGQTLVHTGDRSGYRMQVWRVAARDGGAPVNIAQEPASFWEMSLSPDGKTLVYQVDLPWRSTILRVDLPGIKAVTAKP